jgi:hypothetical protein
MVNTSVHRPHSSIETRMSMPSVSVTPNRPTSGWMSRKYSPSSTMMPPR